MGHGEGRCDIELSGTSADIVDGRPRPSPCAARIPSRRLKRRQETIEQILDPGAGHGHLPSIKLYNKAKQSAFVMLRVSGKIVLVSGRSLL